MVQAPRFKNLTLRTVHEPFLSGSGCGEKYSKRPILRAMGYGIGHSPRTVSYTHLTLPTICSV